MQMQGHKGRREKGCKFREQVCGRRARGAGASSQSRGCEDWHNAQGAWELTLRQGWGADTGQGAQHRVRDVAEGDGVQM